MSLLNEALKDLDRQTPQAQRAGRLPPGLRPGAYRAQGRAWRWGLVAALGALAVVGVMVVYDPGSLERQTLMLAVPSNPAPVVAAERGAPVRAVVEPVPVPSPVEPETQDKEPELVSASAPPSAATEPVDTPAEEASSERAPSPADDSATMASAETQTADREQPAEVREQSLPQQDRALARDIRGLLERGDIDTAERTLRAHLLLDSDAPSARAEIARYWLAEGQPAQVRRWLPESTSRLYPQLRLLQARLAAGEGDTEAAIAWLASDLPGVDGHRRYHVTLAALYQRQGEYSNAAQTWAQLLAVDDEQADWWAGLGIALDNDGRRERALAAFAQARNLPGLSPALQRHVQQRLEGDPMRAQAQP